MSRGTAKDIKTIVGAAGEIVGRTRLQKTAAILEMTGLGYGFIFDYYKFGPYSEDFTVSLERAIDLNYISEEERRSNWGGRYSIFSSPKREGTGDVARDNLIGIAKEADAVALELAVTAAFLARNGSPQPWKEVAERKPEKADKDRIQKAKELYFRLANVRGLPEPLPAING